MYITPACFPDNVYDGDVFESCISNLLSAQFRRLIFDIYWDVSNRQFNFCPAELPRPDNNATSVTPSNSVTSEVVSSLSSTASELVRRQDNSTTTSNTTSSTSNATTTSSSVVTTTTSSAGTELLQLGPYQCSEDVTLDNFYDLFKQYLDSSSSAVQARFHILQFNLHAATPPNDANDPPRRPSTSGMPRGSELLGHRFNSELGGYEYTPSDLQTQRRNLNSSWFQVSAEERLPVIGYYDITRHSDGKLQTPNGWPSENYLLFNQYERFLLTWGIVADEMQDYAFAEDRYVFLNNQTSRFRDIEVNDAGLVTSGCYYSDQAKDVAQVNNSWAVTAVNQDLPQSGYLGNLTSCGLGPLLNATLDTAATDSNYQAYQNFSQGTIFGWASGEPKNSSMVDNTHGDEDQFRCVVLDASDAYRGHWRVVNCQQRFRAACRIGGQPFNWSLSPSEVLFTDAPAVCQDTSFEVPRTSLENTYLYEHIFTDLETQPGDSLVNGVWINLNSLDKQDCWTTTGPNGSCIYQTDSDDRHNRMVLIPSIATLIILILTGLTIVVKCGVNRRHSRQRRMGPGGWEYEGVPS